MQIRVTRIRISKRNRIVTNKSIQGPRHPAPSPAASWRLPLLTVTTRKKSFEDTKLFVEKLSGVKSLDKAIEVQTEFAKTAYETFVTESQKIGVLYSDLAKQSYKPFGDFVAKITPTNR
jgi:hypothetical protein